jgi:hypothetical protein
MHARAARAGNLALCGQSSPVWRLVIVCFQASAAKRVLRVTPALHSLLCGQLEPAGLCRILCFGEGGSVPAAKRSLARPPLHAGQLHVDLALLDLSGDTGNTHCLLMLGMRRASFLGICIDASSARSAMGTVWGVLHFLGVPDLEAAVLAALIVSVKPLKQAIFLSSPCMIC